MSLERFIEIYVNLTDDEKRVLDEALMQLEAE